MNRRPGSIPWRARVCGHDPRARRLGVTILLTTQYMDEADQLAARIAVIDHGKKIAEGTAAN